jgi:hypothetical protein
MNRTIYKNHSEGRLAANNVVGMPSVQGAKSDLNLPAPRVWTPKHLAEFLGVSVSWIYKRTMEGAEDSIPRVQGIGRLRFDSESPAFQDWMRQQLGCGYVDIEVSE